MREIKAQGWDGNKLLLVKRIHFDGDGHTVFWSPSPDNNPLYQNCEQYPVRWYTGHIDQNGKEIYEGDIVKTNEADWIAQVIYRRDCFMCTGLDYEGFSFECNWEDFKVIGNIYENPELLKKASNKKTRQRHQTSL